MRTREPREPKNYVGDDNSAKNAAACLNRIFRTVNEDGLSAEASEIIAEDVKYISDTFAITSKSAVILAAILERTTCGGVNEEDLARFIGCTNIEFLEFHKCLCELDSLNIIGLNMMPHGRCKSYVVSSEALKAIEEDSKYIPLKKVGLTADEFFPRLCMMVKNLKQGVINNDRFLNDVDFLVENNQQLEYCRKVWESEIFSKCTQTERRIFYYLSHRYVSASEQQVDIDILMNLTDIFEDDERLKRYIANERTQMQASGLICFGNADGFSDSDTLALSDGVRSSFFDEIELAPVKEKKHSDLVCCSNIKAKDLFYNKREQEQINRLDSLLDEANFKGVQDRLVEMGMRKGFNAIFWGGPGTGKTACVYELARRCGRDIFQIDMSKLKSKWVGDTEKAVKGVFSIYREMVRTNKKAPILLFNEADAIFSKRLTNVEDSVDQMMNAIQNIILQEMENIEGILIATTNLVDNLDPAFERRFIFKIKFDKPEAEVRSRIWKSMVSDLSEDDASRLADEFDSFSGGNIENISRKATIDYVLTANRPSYDSLVKYCREETLDGRQNRSKIGY